MASASSSTGSGSQYTEEELETLRREGEHLLRVGAEAVARERSNTSPMLYFGSGSDDGGQGRNGGGDDDDDDADEQQRNNLNATPVKISSTKTITSTKLHAVQPAGSSKRALEDGEEGSDSSDSDDSDDAGISLGADGSGATVNIEFDFVDFNDKCFHMTRQLVSNSVWAGFGTSEMTNAIVDQVEVGTVVKMDEIAICGFATALSTKLPAIKGASKKIKSFLQRTCPEKSGAALSTLLSSAKVGYFINGGLVNVPMELAPALHRCFLEDLEWSQQAKTGLPEEKRKLLNFDHLIMLSPVYVIGGGNQAALGSGSGSKKKKKRRRKKQKMGHSAGPNEEKVYYVKYEDEILREHATISYTTALPSQSGEARRLSGFGSEKCLVMVIEKSKLSECIPRLQKLCQDIH